MMMKTSVSISLSIFLAVTFSLEILDFSEAVVAAAAVASAAEAAILGPMPNTIRIIPPDTNNNRLIRTF